MPRKYYPLTPSQKIHFKPIIEFGTQQVANISICMTLQAPLDFGLLKKCIQLEYERYECLRIRFTKVDPNGEVRQYVVSHDDRDMITKTFHGFPVMTLITAWKNGPEFRLTGTIFQ